MESLSAPTRPPPRASYNSEGNGRSRLGHAEGGGAAARRMDVCSPSFLAHGRARPRADRALATVAL
eukprot:scaffold3348_cov113-Isochrysis_galbana.AAC.22